MGNVIYIPGLQGMRQLAAQETNNGPNEQAVRNVCRDWGWEFCKVAYQTDANPTPLLSQMETMVAEQLDDVFAKKSGPFILVGSSVGFGVLLGALTRLQNTTSLFALLGVKPIPDPLLAIGTQLACVGVNVQDLYVGTLSSVPMPVEGSRGDVFTLTPEHMNDHDALRILSDPREAQEFRLQTSGRFSTCELLLARDDHLTQNAADLTRIFGAEVFVQTGDHNTDMSAVLGQKLHEMILSYPDEPAEYPGFRMK